MTRVGFLTVDLKSRTAEEKAAWDFLRASTCCRSTRISFSSLAKDASLLRQFDVLWWHFDASTDLPPQAIQPDAVLAIRNHIGRGRGLLLSLLASPYVVDLGYETVKPDVLMKGTWNEQPWAADYPDMRGFGAYQGNPIFKRFPGGLFSWSPRIGSPCVKAYYEKATPAMGKALAVEKHYIGLNEDRRVLTEFANGRIVAAGDHLYFMDTKQPYRRHLEEFLLGCLKHLGAHQTFHRRGAQFKDRMYWTHAPREVREIQHQSPSVRKASSRLSQGGDSLSIHRDFSSPGRHNQFYDLSGLRMLLMGYERGGIEEAWVHPLRVCHSLRVGFVIGTHHVQWSHELNPLVTIRPESLTRRYDLEGARITEVAFADRTKPASVLSFEVHSTSPVRIVLTGASDLRLMWPLSERATGSLEYAWDEGLSAWIIRDAARTIHSIIGSAVKPSARLAGHFAAVDFENEAFVGREATAVQVAFGMEVSLRPGTARYSFVLAGSSAGESEATDAYRTLVRRQDTSLQRHRKYFSGLERRSVKVHSPDAQLNRAYRWGLILTDRFYTKTPELGESYMAGFGFSGAGWNGGQAVSGRPGYAWYFGRDSIWTSFAALAYGDPAKVRGVLEFLGRYQDINGKILHEMTSSGFAHYDAADATPLYLILHGRYLRATGDIAFVRGEFSRIVKAISYCNSTDTDRDHLIENSHSGHGWVEGGALFPVHVEHYLAACWGEALKECGFIAQRLGRRVLAKKWSSEAARVKRIIKKDFWNPLTGFYRFGKRRDGSYSEEKTILPVVGMYFDPSGHQKVLTSLDEYAGDKFTTDWGVRIVGSDSDFFKPTGYHYGSVWPLFTGWTALAEFRLGRPLQGYSHLLSSIALADQFSAGCVEEVLHGELLRPGGVCPHQAWSESMILQPLLEGMLGLRVDVPGQSMSLAPYLPPPWKSLQIENVHVGRLKISVTINRTAHETRFRIRANGLRSRTGRRSPAITLHLQPILPLGSVIHEIQIGNNVSRDYGEITDFQDAPVISLPVKKQVNVVIRHTPGVAVVPPVPHLQSGSASKGLRIMSESWDEGAYRLQVAGKQGEEYLLDVADPEERIQGIEGATLLARDKEHAIVLIRFPAGREANGYERRAIRLVVRPVRSEKGK